MKDEFSLFYAMFGTTVLIVGVMAAGMVFIRRKQRALDKSMAEAKVAEFMSTIAVARKTLEEQGVVIEHSDCNIINDAQARGVDPLKHFLNLAKDKC